MSSIPMTPIPISSWTTLRRQVESAMTDSIRLYREESDPSTGDAYDTREADIYDGKCSITDDVGAIAELRQGDEAIEGDAVCKLPVVSPFAPNAAYAEVTHRGIAADEAVTRTARVERVMRRRTHMRLLLKWTSEAS